MKIVLMLAVASIGLTPALAEPESKEPSSERVICKTIKQTGTRLARERVCAKKRDWDRAADEASAAGEEALSRRVPPPSE